MILMVPEAGVEPAPCCQGEILSLLRLPFRHSGVKPNCSNEIQERVASATILAKRRSRSAASGARSGVS